MYNIPEVIEMKYKGTIRNLDNLGRVVIPKEYRHELEIDNGQPVEILLTSNGILLKKPLNGCTMCGNENSLMKVGDVLICLTCMEKICQTLLISQKQNTTKIPCLGKGFRNC